MLKNWSRRWNEIRFDFPRAAFRFTKKQVSTPNVSPSCIRRITSSTWKRFLETDISTTSHIPSVPTITYCAFYSIFLHPAGILHSWQTGQSVAFIWMLFKGQKPVQSRAVQSHHLLPFERRFLEFLVRTWAAWYSICYYCCFCFCFCCTKWNYFVFTKHMPDEEPFLMKWNINIIE